MLTAGWRSVCAVVVVKGDAGAGFSRGVETSTFLSAAQLELSPSHRNKSQFPQELPHQFCHPATIQSSSSGEVRLMDQESLALAVLQ